MYKSCQSLAGRRISYQLLGRCEFDNGCLRLPDQDRGTKAGVTNE